MGIRVFRAGTASSSASASERPHQRRIPTGRAAAQVNPSVADSRAMPEPPQNLAGRRREGSGVRRSPAAPPANPLSAGGDIVGAAAARGGFSPSGNLRVDARPVISRRGPSGTATARGDAAAPYRRAAVTAQQCRGGTRKPDGAAGRRPRATDRPHAAGAPRRVPRSDRAAVGAAPATAPACRRWPRGRASARRSLPPTTLSMGRRHQATNARRCRPATGCRSGRRTRTAHRPLSRTPQSVGVIHPPDAPVRHDDVDGAIAVGRYAEAGMQRGSRAGGKSAVAISDASVSFAPRRQISGPFPRHMTILR